MPAPSTAAATPLRRWPSQCAICHGFGAGRICAACLARHAVPRPRCRRCAIGVPAGVDCCGRCLLAPPPFDAALAAVDYGHPWSALIARFKFDAALDLSRAFADLLLAAWRRAGLPPPDLLLPVPLADARLRERGYNQSWELARRVGRDLVAKRDPSLLLRLRDSPHQLALPPGERAANVRGVFSAEPMRAAELRGRRIALVDDVMTTGATLAEAAGVLRQAGAASVQAWVLARTPLPMPPR